MKYHTLLYDRSIIVLICVYFFTRKPVNLNVLVNFKPIYIITKIKTSMSCTNRRAIDLFSTHSISRRIRS